MVCSLMYLALMVLKLLMFKFCGIIGISLIEFFNFFGTERVKPLKDWKDKTVFHGLLEIMKKYHRKLNKLFVDQRREFYNGPMQKLVDDNDILMYSTP